MMGKEPRQTTSNIHYLQKPSIHALIHGLNRSYYQINMAYRKNALEMQMLRNLDKKPWQVGLTTDNFEKHSKTNETTVEGMMKLATNYNTYVQDESKKTSEELVVDRVGKQDPKRHLDSSVTDLMTSNIDQCLGTMLDTVVF